MLHGVTVCYVLHAVTPGYKVFYSVARCYKVFSRCQWRLQIVNQFEAEKTQFPSAFNKLQGEFHFYIDSLQKEIGRAHV